ncbi:MAG: Rpn family recombination-promoting nuclease/putative transposase [Bacteroides sp.]|nr:Rpn family recombination-promoting nuclease/putative transposase [Bacteroides sp.]
MQTPLHPLTRKTFLKLRSDYGFKWLFGSAERAEILKKFLNALFDGEIVVTKVDFHDKEVLPPDEDGKRIVYDAYCTTDTDHHFIVEMQQEFTPHFGKRMVFYMSSGIYRQGESGKSYNFDPVYMIIITDFNMKPLEEQLVNEVVLMERRTHVVFTEDVRMYYLSLECVNNEWEKCESEIERQLYLIKNMEKLNKQSQPYLSGEYDEIFKAAELSSMKKEDIVAYSDSIYKEMEMAETLEYNKGLARAEGRAEGLAQGIAKGITQGIAKGIAQSQKTVAFNLLTLGVDTETISKATGLSVEEILTLQSSSSPAF